MDNAYTKDSVQIARLEERVANIQQDLHEHRDLMRDEMDSIRRMLDELLSKSEQIKGGWKALTIVSGIAAFLVEGGHRLVDHLSIK